MRGIHKHFPGIHVLKGVDFDVHYGEVHALVGENGAGKSTLMHILFGTHRPESGSIVLAGCEVQITDERQAQRLGISIVFQERSLFGPLSVAENIFAGRQPRGRFGRIWRRELHRRAQRILDDIGLDVDADVEVERLAPDQQQMVEVAKALSLDARLIIFDEPTAALTEAETASLFRVIAGLKQRRVGVVYISHRLEEIFQIADRVTVLKDGETQGTLNVRDTQPEELVRRMVGREFKFRQTGRDAAQPGAVRLEVCGLSDPPRRRRSRVTLRDVSFRARANEIIALAGLAGAGRTELALAVFGARPRGAGEIRVDGQLVRIGSPQDAIHHGIGYVPEDRKQAGLFLDMTIAQNIAAGRLAQFGDWWLSHRKQFAAAERFRDRLNIACRGPRQPVRTLSGGNQQKVVLARWLLVEPKVLIVDEPTRGIDVGAKSEVHALLVELSRRGTAVVVISSDLPEVLELADRVLVMRRGAMVAELSRAEASEERVMHHAATSRLDQCGGRGS
jgi:ABC-type sugar transport system ATPase subunit